MPREYLVATFEEPGALVEAVTKVRAHGFKIYDVYTPCPVHGLEEAMGLQRSRLPWVTVAAGVFWMAAAIAMHFYCSVFVWNLTIGGKPDNSVAASVPITFELTVLFAGVVTAKAF